MQYEPLSWPVGWQHGWPPTRLARFLMGIPILGGQNKAFRFICDQLDSRHPDCLRTWGNNPRRREVSDTASAIFQEWLGWRNSLFIPGDPFEIVCWDHTAYGIDHLSGEGAIRDVGKKFGFRDTVIFWEECRKLTYGEVVDMIIRRHPM